MNVVGSYIIRQGDKVLVSRKNIITNMGEAFFMNRATNNDFKPVQYIVLGTSPFQARKSDVSLGNETFRKRAVIDVDLNNKCIKLKCSCSYSEIINTCEIGTHNGDILISHDSYDKITSEDISNIVDSFEITYIFDFSSSSVRKGWNYYAQGDDGDVNNNIYYIVEENEVIRIHEQSNKTMQQGYRAVNTLNELKTVRGAYYYDLFTTTLYIRTLHDEHPDTLEIAITMR